MAGVNPEISELQQTIDALQEKIEGLRTEFEEADDAAEESRISEAITSCDKDLKELQSQLVLLENDSRARKSLRERKRTPKMASYQDDEVAKKERRLFKCYGLLKTSVKKAREAIKVEKTEEALKVHLEALESGEAEMIQIFSDIRSQKVPTQEVREKMDKASAMVRDSLNALEEVLGSLEGDFDADDREEIARQLRNHDYAKSVYGSITTTASKSIASDGSIASERVRLEAELAAKKVEAHKNTAIEIERSKLRQMEQALDLERLEARLQVYRKAGSDSDNGNQASVGDIVVDDGPNENAQPGLQHTHQQTNAGLACKTQDGSFNPNANQFYMPDRKAEAPTNPSLQASITSSATPGLDNSSLAQVLADTMQRSRLPVPVPLTFSGNPLEYVEFQRSFSVLIENRGIPPNERLYYLKQYVTGPARDAVEGFFFGDTQEAYDGAWQTLRNRYGHPFKIQQAFREKLRTWQRITAKDGQALQKFADFLKRCKDAIPYVDGLQVLNDCMENQKLLHKLPDWAITRWNRTVNDALERTGSYPTFAEFTAFVSKEARIATNPISSLGALKVQEESPKANAKKDSKRDTNRDKGSALATKSQEQDSSTATQEKSDQQSEGKVKPCSLCSVTGHHIDKCPQFLAKPLADRKKFVQENKLCFGCLRKGHFSQDCKRRHKCSACGRRHPTSLHEDEDVARVQNRQAKQEDEQESTATSCKTRLGKSTSTSMIVPVWVSAEQAPSSEVLTYALLDTQSDSSFILDSLARALSVQQRTTRLRLSTLTSSSTIDSSVVSGLKVRGMNLPIQLKLQKCYTREFIPAIRDHIPTKSTAEMWPHLCAVSQEIPALQGCEVGLLIGYNCPRALVPREFVTGADTEPYAIRTDLGWSIIGGQQTGVEPEFTSQCCMIATKELPTVTPKDALQVLESDFAEKQNEDKAISQEDIKFLHFLENSITQQDDGHLEMPLPFKVKPQLPDNRKLAMIRLKHLKAKIDRDEDYREQYLSFMADMIDRGYAERVPNDSLPGSINYIPHHGVYHKTKKKLRVVFDCSAKFAGTSLNDHLLKGPDLTNGLVGVLCRFRKHAVAIMCDIEKMFYQFRVVEQDRNFMRFLWWEDGDTRKSPVDYRMTVHLFGAASSPGCANFSLKYLASQNKDKFPLASRFVNRNFYVNDGISSVASTEQANQLIQEARDLCNQGGLRLHKFISNDKTVIANVPQSERANEVISLNLDFDDLPTEKALGITWNVASDTLSFKFAEKQQPMTRRGILSMVASLYDPLGLVAPVTLQGKRVLQEMCRNRVGLDDPIPDSLQPQWERWRDELSRVEQIEIPRCYQPPDFGQAVSVELHHFSDASETGYGQCSYCDGLVTGELNNNALSGAQGLRGLLSLTHHNKSLYLGTIRNSDTSH